MATGRLLDEADRRELVRLIDEDGLSPSQAAARFAVSQSLARRWHARWAAASADDRASGAWAEAPRAAVVEDQVVPAPLPSREWPRRARGVVLALAFVPAGWLLSAAAVDGSQSLRRSTAPEVASPVAPFDPSVLRARGRARGTSLVAVSRDERLAVHRRPGGRLVRRLRARRIEGRRIPLALLVQERRRGWARVLLPTRPNGARGWIRLRDVRLDVTPYRVRIDLSAHRLTLLRNGRRIARRRIAVGQAVSPTPTGIYFVTDLIRTREPDGLYGPYSFGLSGFSPVYTSFRGGSGQIGIHGTNQPQALGTDVSAGCIRVSNRFIRRLARTLPLGTPVAIRD